MALGELPSRRRASTEGADRLQEFGGGDNHGQSPREGNDNLVPSERSGSRAEEQLTGLCEVQPIGCGEELHGELHEHSWRRSKGEEAISSGETLRLQE